MREHETVGECEEFGVTRGGLGSGGRKLSVGVRNSGAHGIREHETIGGCEDFQKKAPTLRLTDAAARPTHV